MERNLVSDVEKVYQMWKEYSEALSEGNTERWLALWTEDGIRMPPGEPYRVGIDQLQLSLERKLELFEVEKFIVYPEEVCIMGDRAYTHGLYYSLVRPIAVGNRITICGKFLTILAKQVDGSWKIAIDCFNANAVGM
ncbi:MAG: nuclear transport factor 2 family protein [Anaerolineales bacterium]